MGSSQAFTRVEGVTILRDGILSIERRMIEGTKTRLVFWALHHHHCLVLSVLLLRVSTVHTTRRPLPLFPARYTPPPPLLWHSVPCAALSPHPPVFLWFRNRWLSAPVLAGHSTARFSTRRAVICNFASTSFFSFSHGRGRFRVGGELEGVPRAGG